MATWLSGISKQLRTIRRNIFGCYGLFLLGFLIIIGQMARLQLFESNRYREDADRLHFRTITLRAERGKIVDANWNVLALDDMKQSLFVDPSLVVYPEFVAQQLAPLLHIPPDQLLAKLTQQTTFVTLKNDLTQQQADAIARLNFSQLRITPAGARFRIGLDLARLPRSTGFVEELAKAVQLPEKQVQQELGDLTITPADEKGDPSMPSGERWLHGNFSEARKVAVSELHYPCMLYRQESVNYAVGVDPREYQGGHPRESPEVVARALAPLLKMTPEAIQRLLQTRLRFVLIKQDLSPEIYNKLITLQSTVFVVEPGKLSDTEPSHNDEEYQSLSSVVTRLYDMLSEKDKPCPLTKEMLRQRLLPGAPPGALAVKMTKGLPDIMIPRRLFAKPIPGVIYGLPGIGCQETPRRHYPYDVLAAPVLGWVGDVMVNPFGAFGIEHTLEKNLRGKDGVEEKEIDAKRRTIPERSTRTEPVDGYGVQLTLDLLIQQAAEEEIRKAVEASGSLQGQCIVMNPENGEILAMATYPSWNANAPGKSTVPLVNTAISNFYEPGSTFKTITVLGALETGSIRDGQTVTYCNGAMTIGHKTMTCAHNARHGQVDCAKLITKSCNLGAATLALKMGPDRFIKWCEKIGLGKQSGIELKHESPGSLNKRNVKAKITLANMGFGQSLAVTPLQMVAAYSVAANGGYLVHPHLVKSVENPDRRSWKETPIVRERVCSEATAALVRKYLEMVVNKGGTGTLAAISGYRVGGKTGTAQKPSPSGGYKQGNFVASFIGIMPIDKPKLTVLALLDQPSKGSHFGGVIAAPVFSEVGRRALQYLHIPPSVVVQTSTKSNVLD